DIALLIILGAIVLLVFGLIIETIILVTRPRRSVWQLIDTQVTKQENADYVWKWMICPLCNLPEYQILVRFDARTLEPISCDATCCQRGDKKVGLDRVKRAVQYRGGAE